MQTHSQGDELKSTSHGMWLLEFFVPSDSMRNLIGDFTEEYRETVNGEPRRKNGVLVSTHQCHWLLP
jgi:hypothetical protein